MAAKTPMTIPIKLLHEGVGNNVTVELKSGEIYRGFLAAAEDNMNLQLSAVTMTQKDGRVSRLQNVYLRGSNIRFTVLPDILKNAPIFKRVQQIKQTYDKKKNPHARTKK
jgi:small nuclear ribonucleoprotein D3